MAGEQAEPSLATRLTQLFDTLRDENGHRYSDEYVSAAVAEQGGPTISPNYVYLLRTGRRDNPTKRHLEALAAFFQVSPAFFFDDELGAAIRDELDVLAALRERHVRAVALRAAELSERSRRSLMTILTQLGDLESDPVGGTRDTDRRPGGEALDGPG